MQRVVSLIRDTDFSSLEVSTIPLDGSCILPEKLCKVTSQDPYLASVTVWATIQLSWTLVLLASQLHQVARQMTTLEVSNLGRYGFMGGRGGPSPSMQQGHQHTHGDGAQTRHQHKKMCGNGFMMQILGLDRFTKGKAVDGMARASKAPNPFNHGIFSNCRDFWSAGRELGVEYERLYQVPPEGFQEAKRRRVEVDPHFTTTRPKRSGIFNMGLSWGRGSRQGYLPVHHDDHA
jgi:hypothetical protein